MLLLIVPYSTWPQVWTFLQNLCLHTIHTSTTMQALSFLGFPSRLGFTLKTHFALMGLSHFGRSMSFQVLFFYMESSWNFIVWIQQQHFIASSKFWGSLVMENRKSPLGASLVVIMVTKSSIQASSQMCFIDIGFVSWHSRESCASTSSLDAGTCSWFSRIWTRVVLELEIDLETMKKAHAQAIVHVEKKWVAPLLNL
jgi:hypothetical protein